MTSRPKDDPSWPIVPPGIWLDIRTPRRDPPQAGLFLDRDGVIIDDRVFLARSSDAVLCPGAADLIRMANVAGVPVLVATNQSGIDRGLFGWDAFAAVEARIAQLLAAEGAMLDAVAACPFHPDYSAGYGRAQARYRKPAAGLITALSDALNVTPANSWMVGDQPRDIEAARAAGLAGGILIGEPSGEAGRNAIDLATPSFTVNCVGTVTEAKAFLSSTPLFAAA